ncbi:hypothetical protein B0H14DRAFT_3864190 [Mycena olivaceomarginata]|nr:hypothetical protein B0H14DRAFT_3864190 [Mycena olivaceomarginata]
MGSGYARLVPTDDIRGRLRRARKVEHPRLHPMLPPRYWRNTRLDRPHPSPHLPPLLLPPLLEILPSFNIHGSLYILGTRARIIVFQHFARSLLPLASTTTTHRDIKLK